MTDLGHDDGTTAPASRVLAGELKKKVRERGLVLWVDAEGQYTSLADRLGERAFGFDYPVVGFRGSYLELMLALEQYGNGLHPEKVLVHLAGLNKETVRETPIYELYKAGTVFEKSLPTLVREAAVGIATPAETDAFARAPRLALDAADQWLASLRTQPRDRLTLLLESIGRDNVVLELVNGSARFKSELPAEGEALLAFLAKELGLSPVWRAYRVGNAELDAGTVAALVASFLMAVEFVHDLNEPPVTPELQALTKLGPVAAECRKLVARLRDQSPAAYELYADEFQAQLATERDAHAPEALGSVDTFRFEESTVRQATIASLTKSDWESAERFATERTPEQCFWVRRSPALMRTWELLRRAATAGKAMAATRNALKGSGSLEEAVERYAEKLAPVDRQARELEQRSHALVASDLEDYDALLEVRDGVRRAYRDWANAINRAFHELCLAHGALPDRRLRQRAVYEDVVHPLLARGGKVAFVMVDALRFEMAQALAQDLKRDKFVVTLDARLAELPTITAVGMNALAPAESKGRLTLDAHDGKIEGLITNEFKIHDPDSRVRAMSRRSLGAQAEAIGLDEFQDLSLAKLKKRLNGKPDLVVVRSQELDTAGEHQLHLGTFDQTLALLKSAISLLQQAGVERFVIASDHGFLLQDSGAESVPLGKDMRVPQRRHALLASPSGAADVLEIKLSALEYDVDEDQYLVFRPDTALWQTKIKPAPFAHGGNSLQERVIPVLVLERQGARGKTTSRYEVVAHAEPAHLGRQRLRIAVRLQRQNTGEMSFASPKTITLALRVVDRRDLAVTLLNADPPAKLSNGRLAVVPERDEALVEFELAGGEVDERVRVEVFHPDGVEEVKPEIVDGFFDVTRDRRRPKPKQSSVPPPPTERIPVVPLGAPGRSAAPAWAERIEDEAYRRALVILEQRRIINEAELAQVLGSPRRVRAFSRAFDDLMRSLPFEVEIVTAQGMKAYKRTT